VSPGAGEASDNTPGPTYRLPDTGQHGCFDNIAALEPCAGAPGAGCATTPLCGQDAQYGWDVSHPTGSRFERTDAAEPVVTDPITGLQWQGCVAGLSGPECADGSEDTYTWADALTYCDELEWGGLTDWRLPDPHELLTIVDDDRIDPALDPAAFPGSAARTCWTSATRADDAHRAHQLEVATGTMQTVGKSGSDAVRCVRGSPRPATARFVRSVPAPAAHAGEAIVEDTSTGLVWQGCSYGTSGESCTGTAVRMSWQEVLGVCEASTWAGHDDWRLPNVKELFSIASTRDANPSIDSVVFPATPTYWYWSSTTYPDLVSSAFYVAFATSTLADYPKSEEGMARCVRGE
jgi:hypothetical protein